MGYYINPGNENFRFIVNAGYVDKTGLIERERVLPVKKAVNGSYFQQNYPIPIRHSLPRKAKPYL